MLTCGGAVTRLEPGSSYSGEPVAGWETEVQSKNDCICGHSALGVSARWVCLLPPLLLGIWETTPGTGSTVGALAFYVDGVPVTASSEEDCHDHHPHHLGCLCTCNQLLGHSLPS